MLRQQRMVLASRNKDGTRMFPGVSVLTWAYVLPGVWSLICIQSEAA